MKIESNIKSNEVKVLSINDINLRKGDKSSGCTAKTFTYNDCWFFIFYHFKITFRNTIYFTILWYDHKKVTFRCRANFSNHLRFLSGRKQAP